MGWPGDRATAELYLFSNEFGNLDFLLHSS
jgi:hypothetical protein